MSVDMEMRTVKSLESLDYQNLEVELYCSVQQMFKNYNANMLTAKTFSLNVKYNGFCCYKIAMTPGFNATYNMPGFLTYKEVVSLYKSTSRTEKIKEIIKSIIAYVKKNNESPEFGGFNYVPIKYRKIVETQKGTLLHKYKCIIKDINAINKVLMCIYKNNDEKDEYIIKVFKRLENSDEQFSIYKTINKSKLKEFEKQHKEQGHVNFSTAEFLNATF